MSKRFSDSLLLLPFHFVAVIQGELREGRHAAALELLRGNSLSVVPRGTVFIRLWMLTRLLACLIVVSLFLHHGLMSHLRPSPFMNLFENLIFVRLILYHLLGGICLWWYCYALNELTRECVEWGELRTPKQKPAYP